jgi:hypothetical protein
MPAEGSAENRVLSNSTYGNLIAGHLAMGTSTVGGIRYDSSS